MAQYCSPNYLYQGHDFFSKSLTQQYFVIIPKCNTRWSDSDLPQHGPQHWSMSFNVYCYYYSHICNMFLILATNKKISTMYILVMEKRVFPPFLLTYFYFIIWYHNYEDVNDPSHASKYNTHTYKVLIMKTYSVFLTWLCLKIRNWYKISYLIGNCWLK